MNKEPLFAAIDGPIAAELFKPRPGTLSKDNKHGKSPDQILPAWFVHRMMKEPGRYGLMLSSGNMLAVEQILEVHTASDGTIWLDVRMIATGEYLSGSLDRRVFTAPSNALEASVNASAVVAAFTYADESAE